MAAEKTHQVIATEANGVLAPEHHLSEHDITRIVTGRMDPSAEQAVALAGVLRRSTAELFPPELAS